MKKLVALALTAVMSLSLVACGGSSGSSAAPAATSAKSEAAAAATSEKQDAQAVMENTTLNTEAGNTKYADVDAPKGFKIGFAYLPPSDTLGGMFHAVLDYTAQAFGCEMVYSEWRAFDAESILNEYENEVTAGAQGVIGILVTGGFVEYMDNHQVYWCVACHPLDESLREAAVNDPYFCGDITEDDYTAGWQMTECLDQAGCHKIGLMSGAPGDTTHDPRCRAVYDYCEQHDSIEVVAEDRQDNSNTAKFDEFVAAQGPNIDGIALTGGNASLPAAIINAGYADSIKYATIDIQGDVRTDLEDGLCVGVSGGQWPTMQIAFVLLYNALASDGAKVIDLTKTNLRQFMWMKTAEDYDNFMKYMYSEIPAYTADELKDWCLAYNSEATPESIQAAIEKSSEDYSIQDVIDRHKDLIG